MSIVEGIILGLVILFFAMVAFYSLGDLFRDIGHYRRKNKNVVNMKSHKQLRRKKM